MIKQVYRNQVHDPARGSFYVGLKQAEGESYRGRPVYVDAFGVKLIILDA